MKSFVFIFEPDFPSVQYALLYTRGVAFASVAFGRPDRLRQRLRRSTEPLLQVEGLRYGETVFDIDVARAFQGLRSAAADVTADERERAEDDGHRRRPRGEERGCAARIERECADV